MNFNKLASRVKETMELEDTVRIFVENVRATGFAKSVSIPLGDDNYFRLRYSHPNRCEAEIPPWFKAITVTCIAGPSSSLSVLEMGSKILSDVIAALPLLLSRMEENA